MLYIYLFLLVYLLLYFFFEEMKNILFYLSIFYYLLEIFSSCLMSYNCCVFLQIIKRYQLDMNEIQKIKEYNKENENINSPTFLKFNMVGDGLFYLIKKKQISLLYLGNILCTFFEFGFDFVITFILKDNPNIYIIFIFFFMFYS